MLGKRTLVFASGFDHAGNLNPKRAVVEKRLLKERRDMISVEKSFWKLLWNGRMSMTLCLVFIYILIFVLVIKDASQTSFIDLGAVMIGIE